jgi:hypothetical protein
MIVYGCKAIRIRGPQSRRNTFQAELIAKAGCFGGPPAARSSEPFGPFLLQVASGKLQDRRLAG